MMPLLQRCHHIPPVSLPFSQLAPPDLQDSSLYRQAVTSSRTALTRDFTMLAFLLQLPPFDRYFNEKVVPCGRETGES